jgi:hypothetical protein
VLKVVTGAAALETGTVSMSERFRCPTMRVGEFAIHDSHPHLVQTMMLGTTIANPATSIARYRADGRGTPRRLPSLVRVREDTEEATESRGVPQR